MNEDQFKSLVRTAFFLQGTADDVIKNVDALLARVMITVREMVSTLPNEGLLRNKAWKSLEPLVKFELTDTAILWPQSLRALDAASGRMEAACPEGGVACRDDLGTLIRLGVVGTPRGTD